VRARRAVISISDLHQNDRRIGRLVARQTTDHWAHATGPWPGCDTGMTRRDFSYMEGNAVCVQLAPPHSYAPLASPPETGRRSQQLSSLINASILVVLSRPWVGRRLPDYTLRYRDTLAYDIAMQFFLTIRALEWTCSMCTESSRNWTVPKSSTPLPRSDQVTIWSQVYNKFLPIFF